MASSSDAVKHTDFTRGSIKRIHLVNFMTHKDTVFDPSSRINVLLGANGSGKSSIVCAFCIGLGGDERHMERVKNLKGYVRTGALSGYVETTLCAGPGLPDILIRRELSAKDNSSKWLLQGEGRSAADVMAVLAGLSIDMTNMTQFLPQEKITEFTKLNSKALLKSVEQALGGGLAEEHARLERDVQNMSASVVTLTGHSKELSDLEKTIEPLEAQKKTFEEFITLENRLKLLDARKLFAHAEKRAKEWAIKTAESDAENMMKEVEALKERQAELLEPGSRAREGVQEAASAAAASTKAARSSALAAKSLEEKVGKYLPGIAHLVAGVKSYVNGKSDTETRLREQKAVLAKAELELKKKLASTDAQHTPAQISALKSKEHAAKLKKSEVETKSSGAKSELEPKVRELSRLKMQLGSMTNMRAKRLEAALDSFPHDLSSQVRETLDYVNSPQGKAAFKKKVYGPLAAEMEAPGTHNVRRALLEVTISRAILAAFVVGCDEDRRTLYAFYKARRIRGTIMVVEDDVKAQAEIDRLLRERRDKVPDTRLAELRDQLGVPDLGWGDVHVKAPVAVLAALHRDGNLWRILLTTTSGLGLKVAAAGGEKAMPSGFTLVGAECTFRFFSSRAGGGYMTREGRNPDALQPRFLHVEEDAAMVVKLGKQVEALVGVVAGLEATVSSSQAELKAAVAAAGAASYELNTATTAMSGVTRARVNLQAIKDDVDRLEEGLKGEGEAASGAKTALHTLRAAERDRAALMVKHMQAMREYMAETGADAVALVTKAHAVALDRDLGDAIKRVKSKLDDLANNKKKSQAEADALKKQEGEFRKEYSMKKQIFPEPDLEILKQLPSTLPELEADVTLTKAGLGQLRASGQVDNTVLARYQKAIGRRDDVRQKIQVLQDQMGREELERAKAHDALTRLIQEKAVRLSNRFRDNMRTIGCGGSIAFVSSEKPADWGLEVRVAFRADEVASGGRLLGETQSGGEKAVSTMLLLLAMQELTSLPFRIVDEINQGMDAKNEAHVMRTLAALYDNVVGAGAGAGGGGGATSSAPHHPRILPDGKQLFIITPKLLPGMSHSPSMRSSIVFNGPEVGGPSRQHSLFLSFCDLARIEPGDPSTMKDIIAGLVKDAASKVRIARPKRGDEEEGEEGEEEGDGAAHGPCSAAAAVGGKKKRPRRTDDDDEEEVVDEEEDTFGGGKGGKGGRGGAGGKGKARKLGGTAGAIVDDMEEF